MCALALLDWEYAFWRSVLLCVSVCMPAFAMFGGKLSLPYAGLNVRQLTPRICDFVRLKVVSLDSTRLALIKQNDQKWLISNGLCSEGTELLSLRKSPQFQVCSFPTTTLADTVDSLICRKWYKRPSLHWLVFSIENKNTLDSYAQNAILGLICVVELCRYLIEVTANVLLCKKDSARVCRHTWNSSKLNITSKKQVWVQEKTNQFSLNLLRQLIVFYPSQRA